ncbi:MAG: bifunctional diaminohydroxyphosphoribosylaminopyrimidine deaminase/5-amino-6-(5-phosphoribosylamino)uracil reductase RibD, partial [Bdellovibrionales bacterium]|nr:bifunctional diaminohydroxyphosphoribosylaminopyrimidine deaminase/5-amino-6-(5-phosphoribosylamino)uracil reductase RibD [Bdellovibrionales bacterium]
MPYALLHNAMALALDAAARHRGATAPNPPVGAAALDSEGIVLGVAAHPRAGTAHAEILLLDDLRARGLLPRLHTLVVTLEPCSHHGRTPPCVGPVIESGAKRVVIGAKDPNPQVSGAGIRALMSAGIEVRAGVLEGACRELIEPFAKWLRAGRPWVTLKRALLPDGSMIPPPGQKTFSSEESLIQAHALRRRADAILTGSGTVIADDPSFTVRKVPDHPDRSRWLIVLDRRRRVPEQWMDRAAARGLKARRAGSLEEALDFLGS